LKQALTYLLILSGFIWLSLAASCGLKSGKQSSLANDTTISLEAREWSKKIDEYPDNVEYYVFRAEVLSKENRHDLSILDYEKAIELDPTTVSHYYMLGDEFFANDETTNALEQYEKASTLNPKDEIADLNKLSFCISFANLIKAKTFSVSFYN
jgi:tetratricopeptide (TPR) repeat protein